MSMIDPENRSFNSDQPLNYDIVGRMPIYDGLSMNLIKPYGFFSIGTSLAGLWAFYSTEAAYELGTQALMHWGGLGYFTIVTVMTGRYARQSTKKINRIYLL